MGMFFEFQRISLLFRDRMEESSSNLIQLSLIGFEPGWQGANLAGNFAMQIILSEFLFCNGKVDSCAPEVLVLSVGKLGEVKFQKPLLVP